MNPTYDFAGQVALVTGASSGMGSAAPKPSLRLERRSCSPTSTRRRSALQPTA
jgi:NADP-dependent 3-hydroxy acid dehydrogenase YdfG